MTVALTKINGRVSLSASGGGGDQPACFIVDKIGPGWKRWGKTYEEWNELPPGLYEIPDDYDVDDDYAPPELTIPA